jgi:hypothetical protein
LTVCISVPRDYPDRSYRDPVSWNSIPASRVPLPAADWGHAASRAFKEIEMDKKIAGLLGAVAGLATMSAANAAVQDTTVNSPLPAAASYAELLAPVSNASELLVADDAARLQQGEAHVQLAQYHHHHHHHHHTKIIIRRRHYHHHHHHPRVIIRRSHHHHHHHHSMFMMGAPKKA